MMLKVQTISKEIVKPSSPTPQHLRKLQLSSLDQAAPQIYTHILLFYNTNTSTNSTDQIPINLKASLSQTLTHFYPLAGRIKLSAFDTLHVDCNDEGVEFTESQTEADFASFLVNPQIDQFDHLLPVKVTEFRWPEDPLLAVQLSMFRGNGLVLGISMSHLIADGASIASFLNCWANIARGATLTSSEIPQFDAAAVFPPQSKLANRSLPEYSTRNDNVVIKRFIMSVDAIERLRKGGQGWTRAPTRVEAVSALVWGCLNRMRGSAGSMMTSVNIRKKMSSKLSERSFGNLWIGVEATEARKVDEEYVRKRESAGWENEGVEFSWILSSWCRISLHRSDFGWGEPVWLGCGIRDMKDVCILIDAKDGDGIEVWLWLERGEMERIEGDEEFLQFVSFC